MRSSLCLLFFFCQAFVSLGQSNQTLSVDKRILFASDYDYPPYEFINKQGEPAGFNVDLIRAIGKESGYKVEIHLDVWTSIRQEFDDSLGMIDVVDMIHSPERLSKYHFLPHHDIISYVIVWNKNTPKIESLEKIQDNHLVVTSRAVGEEYVKKNFKDIPLIHSVTDQHALKMVSAGKYDYALVNQYSAHKFLDEDNTRPLSISEKIVFSEKLSFVVQKDDKELAQMIEEGMKKIKENGTYSKLYIKWFDRESGYNQLIKYLTWTLIGVIVGGFIIGTWIYTLRQQVARKTKQIRREANRRMQAQKLLANKNDELEKRNYELDKIVYSVSHNVRSPIASALGLVNLINIEFNENDNITFYARGIGESLRKLDYYVNKILAYVSNKNVSVKKERIHFDGMVRQVIEETKFLSGAAEVKFRLNIEQHLEFYSDTERLHVILECLLANSVEYRTKRDEPSFVSVAVRVTRKYARIMVEDNGQGIEDKQFDKVFDMFYRGNQRSKGTGLGLYVVKQTIEQLEGSIQLESDYKVGTKMTIYIPNLKTQQPTPSE